MLLAPLSGMARRRRIFLPGISQHVIQRGNNRCAMFRCSDDYEMFLYMLRAESHLHDLEIHAYVLMTNHVHLIVTPRAPTSLPLTMQGIGRRYVQPFNQRYGRSGGLVSERYRAMHVCTERYLLTCQRYVELNPVRAGMVETAGHYRWSSYAAHAYGARDVLLTPHPLYVGLGATCTARQEAWRAMCETPVLPHDLEEIRYSTRTGRMYGPLLVHELAAGQPA